jgi:5-formyltetrahydrofolate cyclo-ligase
MKELRKKIRFQRRQITKFEQSLAALRTLNLLKRFPEFTHSKRVGIYLDAFGEVQTNLIIEYAFAHSKRVYLPKVCAMSGKLIWIEISQNQYRNKRFIKHYLGMREPFQSRGYHVSLLDLLIMPLIACDIKGTRIGMGGGYYDKTLANAYKKPFRLGLAHEFQFIENKIERQHWDQPLDALLTPQKIRKFLR